MLHAISTSRPMVLRLRDGCALVGKTTYETGDAIRAELNDPNLITACIGPAGENLVKFALILTSSAGRGEKGHRRALWYGRGDGL